MEPPSLTPNLSSATASDNSPYVILSSQPTSPSSSFSTSKILVPALILTIIALTGVLFWKFQYLKSKQPIATACTEEAKICPDGTSVGRTGPNCEFAECPAQLFINTDSTANWKTYTNEEFEFLIKYPPDVQYETLGDDLGLSAYSKFSRNNQKLFTIHFSKDFSQQAIGNFKGGNPEDQKEIDGQLWNYYSFMYQDKLVSTLKYQVIAYETKRGKTLYVIEFNNQLGLTPEQDQILSSFRFINAN